MKTRLNINGVWWLRDEMLEDCVHRVNETFHRLAHLAPECGNWFRGYKSIADRERGPLFLADRPNVIRAELIDRQYKHDGQVVADLGYSLTAAAGPPKGKGTEMSFLRINCCNASPSSGFNSVNLELPVESAAPRLYDPLLLGRAVVILADVWDPDWLAAWDRLTDIVPPPWECGPSLGWVNYLPARTGVAEGKLPPAWRWFEERGDKQIFIHENGPPDSSNPEHIRAFEQMVARIRWGSPPPSTPPRASSNDSEPSETPAGGATLHLKYPPTPENAGRFAAEIVRAAQQIDNVNLDYSVASLDRVDTIVERLRRERVPASQVAETLFAFGCYVGEVFVAHAQGKWSASEAGPLANSWPMVELPGGKYCNPIGKVFKRLQNGPEDSLAVSPTKCMSLWSS